MNLNGIELQKIIFDLDGTLINTFPDVSACINRALEKMGRTPLTEPEVRRAIGPGKDAFLHAILGKDAAEQEECFLTTFREFYHAHCLDNTHPFSGIPEILEEFSNLILIVATNKPGFAARRILKGLQILHHFDRVVSPEDVDLPKPHPEMIEFAVQHSPTPKEATLYIGDTDLDIQAGNAAGVLTCGVLYGYGDEASLLKENPDFTVRSPLELKELLLKLNKVKECV